MMEVITSLIAVIISQYIGISYHQVYTLNLYSAMYQLYLSKVGKKVMWAIFKNQKEERKREREIQVQVTRKILAMNV